MLDTEDDDQEEKKETPELQELGEQEVAAWKSRSADEFTHYLQRLRQSPFLEEEEEYILAKNWIKNQDPDAAKQLIESHMRLIVKIAEGYKGYGINLKDLVAEGSVGLMQALKGYDPDKGARFSTYARWWVKAAIHDYIMRTFSLVRLVKTPAQRKLFFSVRKMRKKIRGEDDDGSPLKPDEIKQIAEELEVPEKEIEQMHERLRGRDFSLNTFVSSQDGASVEWQDWVECERDDQETLMVEKDEFEKRKKLLIEALRGLPPRELEIIRLRRLTDPPKTLEDVALTLNISRERVRQIEEKAFTKLQKNIKNAMYNFETF